MNIRILLIEENILFRKGLASLLSAQPGFSTLGDLGSDRESLREAMTLEPDVIVMELRQHGLAGLDMVTQLKRRQPQLRVALLTTLRTEEYVRAALHAGVDGFVLKDACVEELVMALRSVAMGKKYLSPDISGNLVASFLHPESSTGRSSQAEKLTSRERGILQLIAEGRTNRGAAEFLCVSSKTVEKHRSSLMQKLSLRNAAELTLAAMEMGLVERPKSISRLMGEPVSAFAAF